MQRVLTIGALQTLGDTSPDSSDPDSSSPDSAPVDSASVDSVLPDSSVPSSAPLSGDPGADPSYQDGAYLGESTVLEAETAASNPLLPVASWQTALTWAAYASAAAFVLVTLTREGYITWPSRR
jgi:hypothetical protein